MRRLLFLVGLLVIVLVASGHESELVVYLESPDGHLEALDTTTVSCRDAPPIEIGAEFGSAADCRDRCSAGAAADGTYRFKTGVIPALACSGPRGERIALSGSGTLEEIGVVTFCTDERCLDRVEYCDCVEPNLTNTADDRWFSEPFTVPIAATDNHEVGSIVIGSATTRCTGERCDANATVPIGTICVETGREACTLRIAALDRWGNENERIATYHVDLDAPSVTYEWVSDGYWQRDEILIDLRGEEASADQSGVAAIYAEVRSEPGCSEPGDNYTRYAGSTARVSIDSVDEAVALCAYAVDRAVPANVGETIRTAPRRIDRNEPSIMLEPDVSVTNEPTNVSITCSDASSGCRTLRAGLVSGECPAPAALSSAQSRFEATCDVQSACAYTICAWAQDGVGYTTSIEHPVLVDLSEPVMRIASIERSGEDVRFSTIITDTGSGLASCTIAVDDAAIPCSVNGTLAETTMRFSCGETCAVRLEASDAAGNTGILTGTIEGDGWI